MCSAGSLLFPSSYRPLKTAEFAGAVVPIPKAILRIEVEHMVTWEAYGRSNLTYTSVSLLLQHKYHWTHSSITALQRHKSSYRQVFGENGRESDTILWARPIQSGRRCTAQCNNCLSNLWRSIQPVHSLSYMLWSKDGPRKWVACLVKGL